MQNMVIYTASKEAEDTYTCNVHLKTWIGNINLQILHERNFKYVL